MTTTQKQVGEVVESSTDELLVQSYEVNVAPPLGTLVRAAQGESMVIYGVVSSIDTTPIDSSRKPIARGQAAASIKQIYDEHPQLTELFSTHFSVRVLGHAQSYATVHGLPPMPPEVHQLVYACDTGEMVHFTQSLSFLPLLLGDQSNQVSQEVVAAFLRQAALARGEGGHEFLVRAGKQLVSLLRGDSVRLTTLLGRLG